MELRTTQADSDTETRLPVSLNRSQGLEAKLLDFSLPSSLLLLPVTLARSPHSAHFPVYLLLLLVFLSGVWSTRAVFN